MKKAEFLYLSQRDVIEVGLTMGDAIAIVEEVLTEHGNRRVENPPKPGIHPLKDAFIHAMPGYLPNLKAAGMKWVSGFSSNARHDLPMIMGLIVLNDVQTGQPIAVMDSGYITALRTAAVSGVATKFLANKDSKVLGIIGAGIQGRCNLLSLQEVLPGLETVNVFDINAAAVQRFISVMSTRVPFSIRAAASMQEVIESADIAITATGQLDEPIFKEKWIQPGTLVLPVHTRGWEKSTLSKVDKFIVDDWQQFSHVMGGTDGYYAPLPELHAELGEVVVGKKPGRQNPDERIIDFNFGMGIHDILMASRVLARAREQGLGTMLPLIDENIPLA
jgi:ornithine cyclodeaminase/alanine dehydrogenase-like protein (mu-crystallin family)